MRPTLDRRLGGSNGRKHCGTGGGGDDLWDPDGGHVHVFPSAQAAQRRAIGCDRARSGCADAAGTLRGGAFAAVRNFVSGRGARLYRDLRSYRTRGAGCDDRSHVGGDSAGSRNRFLCRSRIDPARREGALKRLGSDRRQLPVRYLCWASVNGTTLSRPCRTSGESAKILLAFTSARVTGLASGLPALIFI